MVMRDEQGETFPAVEEVEAALESFWRGAPEAFDRLLEDGSCEDLRVCAVFRDIQRLGADALPMETQIGEYRLIRQVGHGGMGVVYEAEQLRTGRRVALKVVRQWEMAGDRRIKLFRREIDMLARLKHPHIATLFDAGDTADGHHYFAMELVSGAALGEWGGRADRPPWQRGDRGGVGDAEATLDSTLHRDSAAETLTPDLSLRGRGSRRDEAARGGEQWVRDCLSLFVKICHAIHHAHQRGVIHCDIKPSNIFVCDDGEPKVLDFGLARLLEPDWSMSGGMSYSGKLAGTLHYMSPEQARGRVEDLDIRTDVYSLGVVLYELLAGDMPYPVRGAPWPAAISSICEATPVRPGSRRAELRGDVETIVLKALEKESDRRYASAAALAEDIERYLADQPILARPPSAAYQLRKWVRRHRGAATLAGLLMLTSVGFVAALAVQAGRLAEQRDSAQVEARRSERMTGFLVGMLQSASPQEDGPAVSARDLLDRAAAGIDAELADDPAVRASLHETLGRSYLAMRFPDRAAPQFDAAYELRARQFGERDPRTASVLHLRGLAMLRLDQRTQGRRVVNEAYEIRRATLGENHPDTAESLQAMAGFARDNGDYSEAERLVRQSLAIRRAALGEHRDVAESLNVLGSLLVEAGRLDEAEPVLDEALAMRRKLLGEDHYEVARTLPDLSEICWRRAEYERAESLTREEIRILRAVFKGDSYELAQATSDLAGSVEERGRLREAESLYKDSLAMLDRVVGVGSPYAALNLNNYGAFLRDQGRFKEAEPIARQVYDIWVKPGQAPIPAQGYAATNLAGVLLELGRLDEAERFGREAVATWRAVFEKETAPFGRSLQVLGRILAVRGQTAEAEASLREGYEILRGVQGDGHPDTAKARIWWADGRLESAKPQSAGSNSHPGPLPESERESDANLHAAEATAKYADAETNDTGEDAAYAEATAILRKAHDDANPDVSWALSRWGRFCQMSGDAQRAESLYREAIEIERKLERENHPALADALIGLGGIQLDRGDAAGAEALLREGVEIRRGCYARGDPRITEAEGLARRL